MKVVWLMVPLLHFTYIFTALWTWSIKASVKLIAQLIQGVFCNCMVFVNSSCPTKDSSFFFSFCLSPPASPILHCWQVGSTTSCISFSLQPLQMTNTQKTTNTKKNTNTRSNAKKLEGISLTDSLLSLLSPNENILITNKKPSQTALKNSLRLGKLAFVLCFVRFLSQARTLHFNSIKPNAKHKHTYTWKRKRPKTRQIFKDKYKSLHSLLFPDAVHTSCVISPAGMEKKYNI